MKLFIQVSKQSDKSIVRVAILVWRRRMNTIHNTPCIYLNSDIVSVAEGLLAFNKDNSSQNNIDPLRNFDAHNGIHITEFHI